MLRKAFYLGDKASTWSNPVGSDFVRGPYCRYLRFIDDNQMNTFAHDIDANIRNFARDIYVHHKSGRINDLQRNYAYKTILLPRVEAFKAHWGAKMVPEDVRNAVNDIEREIGVQVTVWPQWEFVTRNANGDWE